MQRQAARDPTPCQECPLRKRRAFRRCTERELSYVSRFKQGELVVEAGSTILLEGSHSPHLFTILEGWAFRHKSLADGRRQVLNFALPGDLVGLQIAMMDEIQHSVSALSRATLCVFQRDRVWSIFQDFPGLAFAMTWIAAREEQLLDLHLLSVGRRSAIERAAHLVLHLYDRAAAVGYAGNDALPVPFRHAEFADAIGVTPVHLSRTLKKLAGRDLLKWNDDTIVILDRPRLESLASYERARNGARPLI